MDGSEDEKRALAETGTGTGTETRMRSETGKRTRMEKEGAEDASSGIHIGKEAEYKTTHCYSARVTIFVDSRWCL